MGHRQVNPEEIDFRVASPVNVRSARDGDEGNRVSTWLLRLPIGEPDPLKQVETINATTRKLKSSHQAGAIEMVEAINEWIPIDLHGWSAGTQNTFVTNVPGPQLPLYLLGAELLELFIQPPLIQNLGLAVGVISYNGKVCWGFNADYDRIPDIEDFVEMVRLSFECLAGAAGVRLEGVRPPEVRAKAPRKKKPRTAPRPAAEPAAAEPIAQAADAAPDATAPADSTATPASSS
jgi:hypothetical protein